MSPERRAAAARLVRFGRPVLWPLGLSLVFRLLGAASAIGLLVVGVRGITAVADGDTTAVGRTVVVMAALALAKGLLRYLEQYSGHWVAFRVLAMLRVDLYRRLVPQSPAGIYARRSGDLLARATKDVDRVEVFFAHTLVPAVAAVVVPAGVLVLVARIDLVLAAAVLVAVVLALMVVPGWGRSATARAAEQVRHHRGVLAQHVTESAQGVAEVVAFGAERGRRHLARREGEAVGAGLAVLARWTAARRGGNALLVQASIAGVAFLGAARAESGALDWTQWLVAVAATAGVFESLLAVEDVAPDLDQAFASARRIWEVTDAAPATVGPASPVPMPTGALGIRFEDVTFTYPGRTDPAVAGLTLDLPPGTVTAVVGPSGVGKTTLVHLLTRAWDPDRGRVLLGGVDVRDLDLSALRATVAVVTQQTHLFNDTVAANLRLASPDATREQLEAACRRAHLHEAVLALPQGYDTVVGELGRTLSGGQRQRLSIARALLADSPVLVLDEATSQLDVATEAAVHDAVSEAIRGRTVLVIAHRPESVAEADRVVRLEPAGT